MGVFFPPDEVLLIKHTILVITRGLMAVKGHVLHRGDTWGHEDILLSNDRLADESHPRTLSFVGAMCLDKESLLHAARAFPSLDSRLRRAQVRTATRRAFLVLANSHRKKTKT